MWTRWTWLPDNCLSLWRYRPTRAKVTPIGVVLLKERPRRAGPVRGTRRLSSGRRRRPPHAAGRTTCHHVPSRRRTARRTHHAPRPCRGQSIANVRLRRGSVPFTECHPGRHHGGVERPVPPARDLYRSCGCRLPCEAGDRLPVTVAVRTRREPTAASTLTAVRPAAGEKQA